MIDNDSATDISEDTQETCAPESRKLTETPTTAHPPEAQVDPQPAGPNVAHELADELREYLIASPEPSQIRYFLDEQAIENDSTQTILAQICSHFLENGELHHAQLIAESGFLTIEKGLSVKAEDALCGWLETSGDSKWKEYTMIFVPGDNNFMTVFHLEKTEKILAAANIAYIKALESGQPAAALFISSNFDITNATEEHRTAATAGVIKLLHDKDFATARRLATSFGIEGEELDEEVVTILRELMGKKDINGLISLGEKFIPAGGYKDHQEQFRPGAGFIIHGLDRSHNRRSMLETLARYNEVFGVTLTLSEKISIQEKMEKNDDPSHFRDQFEALGIDEEARKMYKVHKVIGRAADHFSFANVDRRQVRGLVRGQAAVFGSSTSKELNRNLAAVLPIFIETHGYQLRQCVLIADTLTTNKKAIKQSVLAALERVVRAGARSEVDSPGKDTVDAIKQVFAISDQEMVGIFSDYTAEIFKKADPAELQRLVRLGLAVFSMEEIKGLAMDAYLRAVEAGYIDELKKIANKFGFSAKDIPDQEALKRAAMSGFGRLIRSREGQSGAFEFAHIFSISKEEQEKAVNEAIIFFLDQKLHDGLQFTGMIAKCYLKEPGSLHSDAAAKVVAAIESKFENEPLRHGTYDRIRIGFAHFWLEKEKIDRIFLNLVLRKLKTYNVDIEEVAAVCQSRQVLKNAEIKQAATDLFFDRLKKEDIEGALRIKRLFEIDPDSDMRELAKATVEKASAGVLIKMVRTLTELGVQRTMSEDDVSNQANQVVADFFALLK